MAARRTPFLLLAGDGFSAFGTWIDFLAILTLAAWQFHVTPFEMAIVSAAGLLPGSLAAAHIGRMCDRGHPKRLLLLSIAGRVATTAAILLCHGYALFVALVALRSLFATVAPPAINVLAVRSLPPGDRPRFYSVLNVLNNTAKVLAPAIGTVSSSLSSEALALVLSLLFSGAALATFSFVRMEDDAAEPAKAPGEVPPAPSKPLLPLLWIGATCAFFIFMVNNLVPLVLARAGFDKSLLGVLVSCAGAGNVLSGLWLARLSAARTLRGELGELLRPALLQALGFGSIGLLLWWLPHQSAWVLPFVFFAIGTVSARYAIALNVHLGTHFADSIGRASGLLQGWQNAMIFVAPMIGAVVLDRLGGPALFAVAAGAGLVSLALLRAFSPGASGRASQGPAPA